MAQQNTIENETPEPQETTPEPTLEEEIAAMTGEQTSQADMAAWNSLPSDAVNTEEAPAETPEIPEETPAPADSPELVEARSEIARLNRESELRKQEAESQALIADSHSKAAQYAQQLVSAGHGEEAAKAIAEAERGKYVAQQNLVLSENRANEQYKSSLAKELSLESGMTVESLMVHNTEESMRAAAKEGGPQAKEIARLSAEVKALKKAQVPPQEYSQQGGRVAPSGEDRLLDQYNAGVRTPETEAAAARYGA